MVDPDDTEEEEDRDVQGEPDEGDADPRDPRKLAWLSGGLGESWNRQGEPLTLAEWGALLEDKSEDERAAYKRVAEDTLPNRRWVSTVWLGLNHRFGPGKPLIFETMIAQLAEDEDEPHEWLDYQMRYATEAEALAGHDEAIAWALDGQHDG